MSAGTSGGGDALARPEPYRGRAMPAGAAAAGVAPRPAGEREALERTWRAPSGLRFLTVVNNNYVGVLYVATALLFFVLAGLLALAMRAQLAVADNDLLSPERYNQFFTMHGTVMMFLFAVPAMEAMGVLLLPSMVGARDLPFPRLSAYAFWAYLIGGLVFFASIFFGASPSGGWFMYPPLASERFSPGIGAEFWLLGIGFIEISAIAGAIEIIVGVLRTRAPGMTLDRIPVFAWSMLVFAVMIVFAFPAVIVATALLELERAFDWPFFIAERGGDPLLWQHLFWFFGHPEVYIIFLPAAGMVSMIVPTIAQTPLVAYRPVVIAIVGTGVLSFVLWVHHMFATGVSHHSLLFFSATSMAVSVMSGIQVFAWIATLAGGRVRIDTPALFVLGFLFVFVLGGLTGVMVAVVPFDWQVHDTYFVVAHLHYVLIGGMVFPLFAALYYWTPFTSREPLSERVGRWVFALMFVGFNIAFFPMHLSGLLGMPRRVYTYPADLGWDVYNLVSTLGAYAIAAGVLLFLVDLARRFRMAIDDNAGNVWNAGTLEWLPTGVYGLRSIPEVSSRDPLWTDPALAREVEAGAHFVPGVLTGRRETLLTRAKDATPQALLRVPGPGWSPLVAAIGTAGFFLLLTVKLFALATAFALLAVAAMWVWAWPSDPGPDRPPVDAGRGLKLPVYASGRSSHAWWATMILVFVAGSVYACVVFSYLFLWRDDPAGRPAIGSLPGLDIAVAALAGWAGSAGAMGLAGIALDRGWRRAFAAALVAAGLAGAFALVVDLVAQWRTGLRPDQSAYAAAVYLNGAVQASLLASVAVFGAYTLARALAGRLDARRRNTFDCLRLLAWYAAAQGIAGVLLVHGFPRMVAE